MTEFTWEARSSDGNLKSGAMQANSAAEVEQRLQGMRLTPVKVKKRAKEIILRMPFTDPVPVKSKVVLIRQLATMIDAGLPLVQCLEILASQEPHPYLRKTLYAVKGQVESGTTFADALRKHPEVFDDLFANLVAAGEAGGLLDTILNRLAVYMEKSMALRQRVKSALRYPTVVLVIALGITGVLLVKVVPSFAGIYKSIGGKELPALTQTVINISNAIVEHFWVVTGSLIALVVGMAQFTRTRFGRRFIDRTLLHTPVFGPLIQKAAIARFTRTLGTLISSGVPILDAMEIVASTSGNKIIEEGVLYARDRIAEGKSIASPLMELSIFPKMVVQMIGVGENTGALDVMLTKIADFYEDEVDAAVDGLAAVIEPVMMVFIGGLVAFVLVAMYLPIFSMADNLQGGH